MYALLVILFISRCFLVSQHFFFFRCYTGYTGFHNLIVQLFINETYKINIAHIILFISRVYNNLIFQQIFLGRLLILFTRDLQSFG